MPTGLPRISTLGDLITLLCRSLRRAVADSPGLILVRAYKRVSSTLQGDLSRAGWSTREIEEYLRIGHATAVEDVNSNISDHLTEDLLREASYLAFGGAFSNWRMMLFEVPATVAGTCCSGRSAPSRLQRGGKAF